MGLDELDRALEAVSGHEDAYFAGPRPPELVRRAEEVLGVSLPPTYRRFVSELGAGSVGSFEVYGVINDDFVESSVPNGIWLTLDERRKFGLPDHLVIVGDSGIGEWDVLDTRNRDNEGECPVALWIAGSSKAGDELEIAAPDFGSFFWDGVRQALGLQ